MSEPSLVRPLVVTEGKTDRMHLKAALTSLRAAGQYRNLHFDLLEYEDDTGDGEMLKICEGTSRIPQARPLICIFDRDNPKIVRQVEVANSEPSFKHWGSHVYSFALPVPDHRQGEQSAVSIELYYTDDEIKRQDAQGRRLFLSNEFGRTGRHLHSDLHCIELNKVRGETVSVIDRNVFNQDETNQALSKNSFAHNVLHQADNFDDFDFSQFSKVFDTIAAIVAGISAAALAAEGLAAYTPLPLTISSSRPPESGNRYSVLRVEDTSHGGAKRYSADLLVNSALSKHEIRQIIRAETEILKEKEIYRNEQTERRWRGVPAHVVWLFLFASREDAADYNPFCRSQWISNTLSPQFSPTQLKGNDAIDDIVIDWPQDYEAKRKLYDRFRISRDDYLHQASEILASLKPLADRAITLTERMEVGELAYDEYTAEMKNIEPEITVLDEQAGNIGKPPPELNPFAEIFRSLIGYAFNITFPFSERGLAKWERHNRQLLVSQAIKYYLQEQERVEAELQKLYGKD